MPGKRASTMPKRPASKTKSSASSRSLKPSLLPLKQQQASAGKTKKGAQKARDLDAREKLDKGGMELREALLVKEKKPLVKKQEVPADLAGGGDPLASQLDDLSMAFGAA
ncbi:hypothetical protein JCM10213_000504 [Rhodosporidiobolus nylandii]